MIVGVTGLMRHGKDEVARALTGDERLGFVRVAMADPLRSDMLKLDPYIDDGLRLSVIVSAIGWDRAKEEYPEVRRVLQVYGTEMVREGFGSTAWPERFHRETAAMREAGWHVVIPDVRFRSEVEVPPLDMLFHVFRPDGPPPGAHASERNNEDCLMAAYEAKIPVVTVINDGTLEDLHRNVRESVGPYL